ncbi:RNA methyltransferase [Tenuifilaceae bacterium CYCD]|nr:RNA methyltransferase [Tenuifilaceae bacterium CYCD]
MIRVIDVIATGVREVIKEERSLDQVTSFWLRQNRGWNKVEKGFFAETLAEVVRWWRLLNELKFANEINYGSEYHSAVVNYIALNYNSCVAHGIITSGLQKKIKEAYNNLNATGAVKESIPDWLQEFGSSELGERWNLEIKALNKSPEIILRVNNLKSNRDELLSWFKRERFKAEPMDLPDAIHITERTNIYRSEAFTLGMFEQQDHSSQRVAPFLDVASGMRVIDACAGNGGKTLHLASIMANKGRIIAMDTADWKLAELRNRTRRAGASIVETKVIESSKTIKRLKDSADRLLLDVPCSGLGVLRRNPDSKWKLTPERIDELRRIQEDILNRYWVMVKPQGKLVYATCSILPSENEHQVKRFIDKYDGQFVLEEEQKISPAQSGFDGFYMARIRREF